MIHISRHVYNEILSHAKETYPEECCGVLVGKYGGENGSERTVVKSYRTENINKERAQDRYGIDPGDFNRIDREARGEGLDILGFYHSHPDHPDSPSVFDRERGQADYSYLIVAVNGAGQISVKSWILELEKEAEPFSEEEIELI
jgi:proteasome lid subunit RPN8/RPN11